VRTLDFLKGDTQLLSTAFEKLPNGAGFRGEFILWSLGGGPTILRRGSYSHRWQYGGAPHFALARSARVLFIIDRNAAYHRLLQLDLETGAEREVLRDDRLLTVATAADGNRVAVVYQRGDVEILEPSTMRRIAVAQLPQSPHWVKFLPDGRALATAVEMERPPYLVEIRDSDTLAIKKSLEFSFVPLHMTCDWTGDRFIVATVENRYYVFAAKHLSCLGSYRRIGGCAVAFAPEGEELALGLGGRVQTGKDVLEPQELSLPSPVPKSEAWCVAFSPDGITLAAGYDNGNGEQIQTLRLCDSAALRAKALPGHESGRQEPGDCQFRPQRANLEHGNRPMPP